MKLRFMKPSCVCMSVRQANRRRREEGRMGEGQDRERGKEAGRWVGVTVGQGLERDLDLISQTGSD